MQQVRFYVVHASAASGSAVLTRLRRCGLKYYRERREAKKNAANTKQKMSIEFLTTPADAKSETNGLA